MEYIDGVKINDPEGLAELDADPALVCSLLAQVFCEQIFFNGLILYFGW
jgi:predicted unusual protein kinase regulating ubiquinone biosynthesis (AarF/ABC1/UbiB family)